MTIGMAYKWRNQHSMEYNPDGFGAINIMTLQ